jgi:putative spermidine/putrescine transport system permease protein
LIAERGPVSFSSRPVRLALFVYCAFALGFLLLPILAIVPLSFNSGSFLTYPLAGVSLRWYEELAHSPGWWAAFRNSLLIAVAATLIATPLGALAALGLARLTSTLKSFIVVMLLAPMFVPVIVVGVATYFVYAPLGLANSYIGLVLAHATLATPFVVVVVHSALQGLDVSVLRASASLGAPPATVLWRVLLPLIAPGVAAAAIFAFATSFDEVVVTLFLAGTAQKTLPLKMFESVREQISPAIAAAATLLVLTSVALLSGMELLRRRR